VLTQREDSFLHYSSALARAVPQYGQQLQHNCGKATHARFGFFLAVEHGGLLGPLTAVIGPHKAKAPSAQVTENVPQRVQCGTSQIKKRSETQFVVTDLTIFGAIHHRRMVWRKSCFRRDCGHGS
jgi:hypothetical protein